MRLNFLSLQIIFLMAFGVNTSFASGFSYYKQMTTESEQDAKLSYKHIKKMSAHSAYLDCPIELIERQWRGSESVLTGSDFLRRFINESKNETPNYMPLYQECLRVLLDYRRMDRDGMLRARAIVGSEREELFAQLGSQCQSQEDQILMDVVADSINQETWCQTQRLAVQAGYIAGVGIGGYKMECVTPLGRRFKLRGPSIGIALGVGATLSLPNMDSKNPISYSIALYKQAESRLWTMTNFIGTGATGAGWAVEQDVARRYRGYSDSAKYLYDLRPAVGLGIFAEKALHLMSKDDQSPLYIKLVQAGLLGKRSCK